MDRRAFIKRTVTVALGCGGVAEYTRLQAGKEQFMEMTDYEGKIVTVTGAIDPSEMGITLPHEHVMVDFVGADKVSKDRYCPDEVVSKVLPYLEELKALGCRTLVECTPEYLGRDVAILKRLSEKTGLQMLTNTGFYGAAKDKYVPDHAYRATVDELAGDWIEEWKNGIKDTSIRPGFIKIGVDTGPLSKIDAKLVRAAARTHLETGLTIATHTGGSPEAVSGQLSILAEEGVSPSAWIWVHANKTEPFHDLLPAAEAGGWIEFDGIRSDEGEALHFDLVTFMKEKGFLDQVLISHDAGWYRVGEPDGGKFVGFARIFQSFLSRLRNAGWNKTEIDQLVTVNPAKAFSVCVRSTGSEK